MQSTAFELVRDALVDLDIPKEEVTPEAGLRDELDIDSTELVEVIASINAKIGTRINGKAIKGIRKVGELADIVDKVRTGSAVAS